MDSRRQIRVDSKGDKEMTFEDAFKEELNIILKAPRQMQLYFVLKSKEGFVLRLADIEDEKTEPEIQS